MYNELVNVEKQPVNQAYKGYVVNQVLDTYKIYMILKTTKSLWTSRIRIHNEPNEIMMKER